MLEVRVGAPVSCRMAGRVMQHHGWERGEARRLDCHLLVYLLSGTAEFVQNGIRYPCRAGDALLVPAGTLYTADTPDLCEYIFFHFDAALSAADGERPYTPPDVGVSFTLPPPPDAFYLRERTETGGEFEGAFFACLARATESTRLSRLQLDAEFYALLLHLSEGVTAGETTLPPLLQQAKRQTRAHLRAPLTAGQLARMLSVSTTYLARLFRVYLHTTPTAWIHREKLSYARELLCHSGMNVTEISLYLGYMDAFYFSRQYKRLFGVSPQKDRAAHAG